MEVDSTTAVTVKADWGPLLVWECAYVRCQHAVPDLLLIDSIIASTA